MNKKNVQAFTLMELLAVLVILAIIALIVFPMIGDVITDSKMKAFKNSVEGLEHAVDLDYQKDYYTGVREYSYENGNLVLNSVKGESKNKNIKVEGIIENGVGTVSVDKDGNTSLFIYNDEYCAIKDYSDKNISTGKVSDNICKTKISTSDLCFDYEKIPTSYDINLENCKTYVTSQGTDYSDADIELYCTKGQTASDGASLEQNIEYGYENAEELEKQQIINNAVYGEIALTDYKCYEGNEYGYETVTDIVIPSKIDGLPVHYIGGEAFKNKGLTSAIIPSSITYIGEYAFSNNNLTNITIPNSIDFVEGFVFANNNLTSVTIPSSVEDIADSAFANNNLTSVTIPSGVEYIGAHAFMSNKITNLELPNTVKIISPAAFNDNQLPDNHAFIYARNDDGSIDNTTVVSYGGAKRDNITLPANITNIFHGAFLNNNITSIDLGNNLKWIGYDAFTGNNLTSVYIPRVVEIYYGAFTKNAESNPNLTLIEHRSCLDFYWYGIIGIHRDNAYSFNSGTIEHELGNITVTSNTYC